MKNMEEEYKVVNLHVCLISLRIEVHVVIHL